MGRALTPERTDWSRDPAPPLLCCLSHVCCWTPEEPGAGHPLLEVSSAQSPDPAAACTEPRGLPGGSSCSQDNDSDLVVPSGEGLAGFGGTQSDIFSSTPPQLGVPDLCTWGVGHSSTLISIFPEPYGNGSLPGSDPLHPWHAGVHVPRLLLRQVCLSTLISLPCPEHSGQSLAGYFSRSPFHTAV